MIIGFDEPACYSSDDNTTNNTINIIQHHTKTNRMTK